MKSLFSKTSQSQHNWNNVRWWSTDIKSFQFCLHIFGACWLFLLVACLSHYACPCFSDNSPLPSENKDDTDLQIRIIGFVLQRQSTNRCEQVCSCSFYRWQSIKHSWTLSRARFWELIDFKNYLWRWLFGHAITVHVNCIKINHALFVWVRHNATMRLFFFSLCSLGNFLGHPLLVTTYPRFRGARVFSHVVSASEFPHITKSCCSAFGVRLINRIWFSVVCTLIDNEYT